MMIASGGQDTCIKVWNYNEKDKRTRCCCFLEGHTAPVTSVCFHRRLPWIVSASQDRTVRIWDFEHGGESLTVLVGYFGFNQLTRKVVHMQSFIQTNLL